MTRDLDHALAALGAHPLDHGLQRLEADVWLSVRSRAAAAPAFGAASLAAVTVALGLGVLAGGVTAAAERRSAEVAVFAVHTPLAPSSLLARPS